MNNDGESNPPDVGASAVGGAAAVFQMGLEKAVSDANQTIMHEMTRRANLPVGNLQGFFAEVWHSGTFSVDAYKKGLWKLVATTPHSTGRGSPDVVVARGDELLREYQAKFYRTASATARQLWNPDYDSQRKLVPSDQLAKIKEVAARKAVQEAASRPHVARSAQHTASNATDHVAHDGVESTPISRSESAEFAQRARDGEPVIVMDDVLTWKDVARNASIGGAVAAGLGFAAAATPHIIAAVRAYKDSNRLSDEAFQRHLGAGLAAGSEQAFWSGLQGAVATGLVFAASKGALGEAVRAIGPGPIGALAVISVHGIRDGLAVGRGELDVASFAGRTAVNAASATGGLAGAAVGQVLVPVPVVGGLVGSTVGALVARHGVKALEAPAEVVLTALREESDAIAYVLGDLDALAEAQSARIGALLGEATQASVTALRQSRFRAFADLRLAEIDVDALSRQLEHQEASVIAWEAMSDEWSE